MNCRQTMNSRYVPPVGECVPGPAARNDFPDDHPVAMAYVPWQTFHHTLDLPKALMAGTIFPELCQPFCGRGPRR